MDFGADWPLEKITRHHERAMGEAFLKVEEAFARVNRVAIGHAEVSLRVMESSFFNIDVWSPIRLTRDIQ